MIEHDARYGSGKAKVLEFTGLREMHDYGKAGLRFYQRSSVILDPRWAGGTPQDAQDIVDGRKAPREMKRVQDLLAKIDASFRDREAISWEPAMGGAYPVVPEALQGIPECMRARMKVESDIAPIRIFVDMFVSGSVDEDDVATRGAAAAALAIRMAESRPVELWCCLSGGSNKAGLSALGWKFPVPVNQASAAEVTAAIASTCMFRTTMIPTFGQHDGEYNGISPLASTAARKMFGLDEADIYVPPCASNDGMIGDPVQWVNNQLRKQRVLHDD